MTEQPQGNYNQPPQYPNQPQPAAYSSQYAQQGAYAGYAQIYGQGLPQHMEAPQKPQPLKIAVILMYVMVGISAVSSLLQVVLREEIERVTLEGLQSSFGGLLSAEESAQIFGSAEFESMSGMIIVSLAFSALWIATLVVFTVFLNKGQNWARIVLTIYAIFSLLGLLGVISWMLVFHWTMILGPLSSILAIVFLVLVWQKPVSEYIKQVQVYKQWQTQQAYLGR